MTGLRRTIPLCAAALVMAATPIVGVCSAYAATMAHCAMSEMDATHAMDAMGAMGAMESMERPGCHDANVGSHECCDFRPAPESSAAPSGQSPTPPPTLDAGQSRGPLPRPGAQPELTIPADAGGLHDLGLHTLFSSFLL